MNSLDMLVIRTLSTILALTLLAFFILLTFAGVKWAFGFVFG